MKTFLLRGGFGLEHLQLEEQPIAEPGPGEVLVHLHAASLNYRDLLVVQGKYNPRMPLPRVPLSDGAGEIAAVGAGVSAWKVGDRVVIPFMPGWREGPLRAEGAASALGGAIDGVLREFILVPAAAPLPIPGYLSFTQAATLPCAAVTAWNGLFAAGSLQPGQTVLLQGTGGVSLFGLQLARLAGAETILLSSSQEKLARGQALGADHLINYKTTPDWDKTVWEITGKRGVDLTLEVGGAGTLNRTLRATALGGHVSLIGVLSGSAGEIETAQILHKAITVQGVYVGSRALFADLLRTMTRHRLEPILDREFTFAESVAAFRHLESGRHFGKIVITL